MPTPQPSLASLHSLSSTGFLRRLTAGLLLILTALLATAASGTTPVRERLLLDAGWRFAIGHATDPSQDFGHATGYFSYVAKTGYGDGPASAAFDDRGWSLVDLPHDWAAAEPFSPKASASHGYKTVGPRFPERSVGWYRHHFFIPAEDLGRRIRIDLDGAFRNSRVFINGFLVGEESSGTLDSSYDLSDYLNYGGDNTVVVRVDASMEEGWYYEGAGIYRHVWLTKTEPLHIERHGTWVRSELGEKAADLSIDTTLINEGRSASDCVIKLEVFSPEGTLLAQKLSTPENIKAGASLTRTDSLRIESPKLWSLETPALHTLVTSVIQAGKNIDRTETKFGVRSIHFDPNAGFFLNGKAVKIKGTNNHQDHAGLGVALPDAMQDYRVRLLKEMGSNTYRTSHHPPTPELLDACDRLGLLVIDETRLMGSNPHHLSELERMIRRDRNHPCVILWSLGNEEWGIEGNIKGARITTTMQDFAKRIDPTRPTTVAISGGWGGTSSVVEAAGVNYIAQGDTDRQHAQYPRQIILGTEETTTQGTRGIYVDDRANCHLSPQEDGSSRGNCEKGWKHYAERPWTAGVCFWTGFDYRGEATPFGWPAIGSQFGILDTCGFPKDSFYYLKSWWSEEPVLYVFPHWNWPGREGREIDVRAHSNCEEVELFLNGTSLGRKRMETNGHLSWMVKYTPGTLAARGYRAGKEVLKTEVQTTGAAASLALTADRQNIKADGRDVSVITVSATDARGRVVPTACVPVSFTLRGPGRILGVGNGDPSSLEPDQFRPTSLCVPIGSWKAPEASPSPEPIVFEASFDLPKEAGADVELLLNALGPKQTVVLNGKVLYRDAGPELSRCALTLKTESLLKTGNTLRIESSRFGSWSEREALGQFHPASLHFIKPAGQWKRSTFNGLAQIIIQSEGKTGELVLEASSEGLKTGEIRIKTQE